MLRIFHNTKYEFVKHWRLSAGLTIAFILAGLVTFGITGGVNYSIEFTGGTLMQVQFKQAPDVADVRNTLDAAGITGAEIQQYGSNTEYTIRARSEAQVEAQAGGAEGVAKEIQTALDAKYGAGAVTIVRTEAVGPKVGAELRTGAAMAMLIASLFTLVYLAIRFDWRFGAAAVLATAHDILVTIAFIKLMNLEVSLTIVAAILTLLGYSANDTIIIFDRVRENLRKPHKGEGLAHILDRSINETLPRSVMTHATTLAATLALLFIAGEVIRPFAWVMAFGVFVATFSSIYVAGPILLWIESKYPREAEDRTMQAMRKGNEPAAPTGRSERLAAR
ncbi:MAG: protein translocase subunit SecF [Gemmatimonas sp.]|uniref:protein translocase subunit SecF n=1 Tax=Gemmatimonas sp. UBA7669 TaxID=1946568 RepID=UPI0025BA9DF2|nr:protein translocase subunit SecF [Gemmatimonas sp. UBA7669]MBA3918742.1 protein translocase subunit SecF [Gemmatimonas sp.]